MTDDTESTAVDPDGRVGLALAALAEVTDPADVGPLVEVEEVEPGVVDLRFASNLAGYAGWRWTVSTAAIGAEGPTVLEVELLPSDGSLLAPAWVPWAERLAEWRKAHPQDQESTEDDDEDDDEDLEDEDDDELDEDVLDDEVEVEEAHDAAQDSPDVDTDDERSR